MTRDRVYAWLLRVYPTPFRRRFGDEMMQAFASASNDNRRSAFGFWSSTLSDICRTAFREHFDPSRRLTFVVRWVSHCSIGAALAALTLLGISRTLLLMDRSGVVHASAGQVPMAAYTAIAGGVIGLAQAAVLWRYVRWRAIGIVAVALLAGLFAAVLVGGLTSANMFGVGGPRPIGYGTGFAVWGLSTGIAVARAVNASWRRSVAIISCSALAVPAGVASIALVAISTDSITSLASVVFYFAVLGAVLGAVTVVPLAGTIRRAPMLQ